MEGVTDREGLLEVPFSYKRAAGALGLDTQDEIGIHLDVMKDPEHSELPDLLHADVDLSDFHPDTITWLGWAEEIWQMDDPLRGFARLYLRHVEEPSAGESHRMASWRTILAALLED